MSSLPHFRLLDALPKKSAAEAWSCALPSREPQNPDTLAPLSCQQSCGGMELRAALPSQSSLQIPRLHLLGLIDRPHGSFLYGDL
jgi:hypothetical protein